MALELRSRVEKWDVQTVTQVTKEFFNQDECRTLWCRMGILDDVEQQLRNRVEMKEVGLSFPHGDEQMYSRWLKCLSDPEDHAKAMVLLQRTQEIPKSDRKMLRNEAGKRFGEDKYDKLLRTMDDMRAPLTTPKSPTVGKQNILLAALKDEKKAGGLDWEQQVPQIIRSLRSGYHYISERLSKQLTPDLEGQRNIRRTHQEHFHRYVEDRKYFYEAMRDMTKVTHILPGYDLVYREYREHWDPLLSHPGQVQKEAHLLSEQQMWTHIRELVDQ
jgi:hypothetical protein